MKKINVDIFSYAKTTMMGLFGLIAWIYSNSKGVTGEGMELTITLSVMFIIIGILGILLTKYFLKRPLKSTGIINKNDEMFVNIRAKAAELTLDIFNIIVFIFIILISTQIINITINLYWMGIITFVGINLINIVCTVIVSNRLV